MIVLSTFNPLKPKFIRIFQTPVRTSNKADRVSIINSGVLMLFILRTIWNPKVHSVMKMQLFYC